jgi:S1-C subfamily serine protease
LERDENIKLTLPGGGVADASLAGRDPTTDVAVLRFQPDGLPVATTAEVSLRAGQVILAVGNHDGAPLAALGIVALSLVGLGTAFAVVLSTASFALTWHSVPRLKAAHLSTCKAVSSG